MTISHSNELYRHLLTITGHSGAIYSIQYDGSFIYSASADKFVTRWNFLTGKQDNFAIKLENIPYAILVLNNSNNIIIGTNNGKMHIIDLIGKQEIKCFEQHQSGIFYLLNHPVKNRFYSSDASGNIGVWCSKTWKLEVFIPLNCGKIRRIVLDENENKLFVAGQDGYVYILDTEFYNLINKFYGHEQGISSIMICEDEKILFTGGKDALLKQWDLTSFSLLKSIPAHNFVLYDIVNIGLENFATISRDKSIKIWQYNPLHILLKIDSKNKGHQHSVNGLIKIDKNHFATCSDDKSIRVFGK